MELYSNPAPKFTAWVIDHGFLNEEFVLVDAGCQDGVAPRWNRLGDHLRVYGFDPLIEVIEELKQHNPLPKNYNFFHMALNDFDGTIEIVVPENKYETSFYASHESGDVRTVESFRLDTLYEKGEIPECDFIKLDCEGAELAILQGGRNYFSNSPLLGVESETNFNTSPTYPLGHFQEISREVLKYGLVTFDMSMDRTPRPQFAKHIIDAAPEQWQSNSIGSFSTLNALFAQNLNDGVIGHPDNIQRLIKHVIMLELYGLHDSAYEVLLGGANILSRKIDVE